MNGFYSRKKGGKSPSSSPTIFLHSKWINQQFRALLRFFILWSVFQTDKTNVSSRQDNSVASKYHPGVNIKIEWGLEDMLSACNSTWETQWVCDPDDILSQKQASRLNYHLMPHSNKHRLIDPLNKDLGVGCEIKLKAVLVRDIDSEVTFSQHGYSKGVSYLAKRMASAIMWDRNEGQKCCHQITVLMSYHQGRVYYGVASCRYHPINYCRIMKLFERHQSALYKREYFQIGLQKFWTDIREEFRRPEADSECDQRNPSTTPDPNSAAGPILYSTKSTSATYYILTLLTWSSLLIASKMIW